MAKTPEAVYAFLDKVWKPAVAKAKVEAAELQKLLDANDEVALDKLFAGFLTFGTAGLRGPIAPGPSGMNRAAVVALPQQLRST